MGTAYSIQITGQTYAGDTVFPVPGTSFTPIESFARNGVLTVEQGITPSNANNGQNLVDVGLFAGDYYGNPQAGAIQFATNTALYSESLLNQFVPGNSRQSAALDVAFESYDPQTSTLSIDIDGPDIARSSQLNSFIKRTSLLTAPEQILDGNMQIQFLENGGISGSISFLGNGYIQPGTYLYEASFTGVAVQNFIGAAETPV